MSRSARKQLENEQKKDWDAIFKYLEPFLLVQHVENKISSAGIPDSTFTLGPNCGWIEFKQIPCDNPHLKISLPHWTGEQRYWMRQRKECPFLFLFLRVGKIDFVLNIDEMFLVEQYTPASLALMKPHTVFTDCADKKKRPLNAMKIRDALARLF